MLIRIFPFIEFLYLKCIGFFIPCVFLASLQDNLIPRSRSKPSEGKLCVWHDPLLVGGESEGRLPNCTLGVLNSQVISSLLGISSPYKIYKLKIRNCRSSLYSL